MPLAGGGVSTGGGGGGGGTNSTWTETRHETLAAMVAEVSIITVGEQTSGAVTSVDLPVLATAWVQFPSGYNGNIRASGTNARTGLADTETLTNTGAGIIRGSKVWVGRITYENLTPGGNGTHSAQLGYSKRICAATAPVVSFLQVYDEVAQSEMAMSATVDLTNGWVQLTATPDLSAIPHVYYRVSHTHTIS